MSDTDEIDPHFWRAAVIGCGRIGADGGPPAEGSSRILSHAEAYISCSRTRLSGLSDVDAPTMNRAGDRWRVNALYTDPLALLSEIKPEIVSICTPATGRVELLAAVLETSSVRAVLLEKPLAVSQAEADIICQMAEATNTVISVDFCRRFPPAYRNAAERIRAGGIGKLQHVAGYYTKGIINNGGHMFDLMRWWFGEPLSVQPLSWKNDKADPDLDLAVEFPNNIVAWIKALDATACNIFEIDIIGTKGRLVFRDQGHQLDEYVVLDTLSQHGFCQLSSTPKSTTTELASAVRLAISDLISAVESGESPACSVRDGRDALALSLQAIDAAKHLE